MKAEKIGSVKEVSFLRGTETRKVIRLSKNFKDTPDVDDFVYIGKVEKYVLIQTEDGEDSYAEGWNDGGMHESVKEVMKQAIKIGLSVITDSDGNFQIVKL